MSAGFLNEIRKMAEEVTAGIGCYLYDIEFVGSSSGRVLRLTIDKDGEGGVSIEDCTNVSRGLNQLLDETDLIPGEHYDLEVSSPGLERVLKEPRHFERAIGKKISVKTFAPLLQFNEHLPELGKAKQVQGKLISFDESGLKVSLGEGSEPDASVAHDSAEGADSSASLEPAKVVFVPLDSVTKAHMVFEFVDPSEKKNPKGQKKKGKSKK